MHVKPAAKVLTEAVKISAHLFRNNRTKSSRISIEKASGCVRSSVVDAFSLNFKVLVPEDAVYDRSHVSHAVNLFDMSEKYADVAPTQEVLEALRKI